MCDYNPFTHTRNKKGFILEEKLHLASLSFVHAVMTQTVCPKLWEKLHFTEFFLVWFFNVARGDSRILALGA